MPVPGPTSRGRHPHVAGATGYDATIVAGEITGATAWTPVLAPAVSSAEPDQPCPISPMRDR
jgi:hypothetical protein